MKGESEGKDGVKGESEDEFEGGVVMGVEKREKVLTHGSATNTPDRSGAGRASPRRDSFVGCRSRRGRGGRGRRRGGNWACGCVSVGVFM